MQKLEGKDPALSNSKASLSCKLLVVLIFFSEICSGTVQVKSKTEGYVVSLHNSTTHESCKSSSDREGQGAYEFMLTVMHAPR